jgi:zinc transport system ATP-binding protein
MSIEKNTHETLSHGRHTKTDEPCIVVKDLGFSYYHNKNAKHRKEDEEKWAFKNVSFTINNGEYIGLLGPNGGGKSTLLKVISGILKPGLGEYKIHCQHGKGSIVGYVPQKSSQTGTDFPATVREIVLSGRTPKAGLLRRLSDNDREVACQAIRSVCLESISGKRLNELSGGERQKVFIARALAGQPSILVLDEPTTDIDSASRESFYELLQELNEKFFITMIFVSHDIEALIKRVNRVIYLDKEILFNGTPEAFLESDLNIRHD